MSFLDVMLIVLLVVSGYTGSRRGAAQQLATYVGLGAGLVGGTLLAPHVAASCSRATTASTPNVAVLVPSSAAKVRCTSATACVSRSRSTPNSSR